MTSGSDERMCPLCDGRMDVSFETRPHDIVSGICIDCGFHFWTELGVAPLESVNDRRESRKEEEVEENGETEGERYLKPLKELPIDLDALDDLRLYEGLEPLRYVLLTTPLWIKRIKKEVKDCKLGFGWSMVLLFLMPFTAGWQCILIANNKFKALRKKWKAV